MPNHLTDSIVKVFSHLDTAYVGGSWQAASIFNNVLVSFLFVVPFGGSNRVLLDCYCSQKLISPIDANIF